MVFKAKSEARLVEAWPDSILCPGIARVVAPCLRRGQCNISYTSVPLSAYAVIS